MISFFKKFLVKLFYLFLSYPMLYECNDNLFFGFNKIARTDINYV